jgi:hypothetical protein
MPDPSSAFAEKSENVLKNCILTRPDENLEKPVATSRESRER